MTEMAGMVRNIKSATNDADLWDNFRSGSEEAYAIIYTNYVDVLYSYGCRINTDKEFVKDCIQDLFINIWNSCEKLGPTNSIKYYLFRALRREIVRKLKLQQNANTPTSNQVEFSFEEKWIEAEEQFYSNHILNNAIAKLSERQREAIYLKFYQNMEFEEIALLMDITPRAVYKLIYRAIDVLQKNYFTFPQSDASSRQGIYPQLQLVSLLLIAVLLNELI